MKQGDKARLKVKKHLRKEFMKSYGDLDATVWKYDSKEGCMYLILNQDELPSVSLDIIYGCEILSEGEKLTFTGRVKERYYNELGKVLKVEIENGFYKISINAVDKQ